jgi:hypothetical protein
MLESALIGLLSSVITATVMQLAFKLRRKRQLRIATEIANTVTAELGEYNPNAIREALDKKDPKSNLMRIYFNSVRSTA